MKLIAVLTFVKLLSVAYSTSFPNTRPRSLGISETDGDWEADLTAKIPDEIIRSNLKHGELMWAERDRLEEEITENTKKKLRESTKKSSLDKYNKMARLNFKANQDAVHLTKSLNLDNKKADFNLRWPESLLRNEPLSSEDVICFPNAKYRNFDGTCNNPNDITAGALKTPFYLLLPKSYDDGLDTFRRSTDGTELPSAREISSKVNIRESLESNTVTALLMTFGQFIDHDLTQALENEEEIHCCDPTETSHAECAPISIPADDPFYADHNQTCLEFVRSAKCSGCQFNFRQQLNTKTAFIDGSMIYGSDIITANSLRSNLNGHMLLHETTDGVELLPQDQNLAGCNMPAQSSNGQFCFRAGDGRVNEQISLTAMHTIFTRHHNNLASSLQSLNPGWNDEKLFHEARKIMGAQIQHIVYNEFLPPILGDTLMNGMKPFTNAGRRNYVATLPPAISSAFSAAAFRFGHSLISGDTVFMDEEDNIESLELSTLLMNPFMLYTEGKLRELMRGATLQKANTIDEAITKQVVGLLFPEGKAFGSDLMARNIQRGRDHGLPSYNNFRQWCGLPYIPNFISLRPILNNGVADILSNLYSHVDDVDLFVGGISEIPYPGSLLGPTFACIVRDQFIALQYGDRFYYETTVSATAFTDAQLNELHKTTLASIMCQNIPDLKSIQERPMEVVSNTNSIKNCSSIPSISLNPWIGN